MPNGESVPIRGGSCRLAGEAFAPQSLAQKSQQPYQLAPVLLRELEEQLGDRLTVLVVHGVGGPLPLPGELDDGRPPVGGVGLAPDQLLFFHSIDQRGDVAPGDAELVADAAHDLGPTTVQRPQQPHPRICQPPVLQTGLHPPDVRGPEAGELVHQPQRQTLRSLRSHSVHTLPHNTHLSNFASPSLLLTYIVVNVTVYVYIKLAGYGRFSG